VQKKSILLATECSSIVIETFERHTRAAKHGIRSSLHEGCSRVLVSDIRVAKTLISVNSTGYGTHVAGVRLGGYLLVRVCPLICVIGNSEDY
jgi:hypothetical protein